MTDPTVNPLAEDGGGPRSAPPPRGSSSFRTGLIAGGIGLMALVAGSASLASAQTPTLDQAPTHQSVTESGEVDVSYGEGDEAWQAYDTCTESHLTDAGYSEQDFFADVDEQELSDADFEAMEVAFEEMDAAFEAADAVCIGELPEDVQAEFAAESVTWDAFGSCLDTHFEALNAEFDDAVYIDAESGIWASDADGESLIIFGDTHGSVTITGDANDLSIEGSGVDVLEGEELEAFFGQWDADAEEWEAAMANAEDACIAELPEDLQAEIDFSDDYDDGDFDDEYFDGEFDHEYLDGEEYYEDGEGN